MHVVDIPPTQPYNSAMGFWSEVFKKLPTWKGTINFFYVATNWSTISGDLEQYRQQIKDRDQWLETYKEKHKEDIEKITTEAANKLAASEKTSKSWESIHKYTMELLMDTLFKMALKAQLYPREWEYEKSRYMPYVQDIVESMRAKIPKPPLLPSDLDLARLTGGLIRPQVGTFLAEGGKDKDKDPSKR